MALGTSPGACARRGSQAGRGLGAAQFGAPEVSLLTLSAMAECLGIRGGKIDRVGREFEALTALAGGLPLTLQGFAPSPTNFTALVAWVLAAASGPARSTVQGWIRGINLKLFGEALTGWIVFEGEDLNELGYYDKAWNPASFEDSPMVRTVFVNIRALSKISDLLSKE